MSATHDILAAAPESIRIAYGQATAAEDQFNALIEPLSPLVQKRLRLLRTTAFFFESVNRQGDPKQVSALLFAVIKRAKIMYGDDILDKPPQLSDFFDAAQRA